VNPPTAGEVHEAWKGIDADGPGARNTLHLAALAITDPVLRQVLRNMRESYLAKFDPNLERFAEAMLTGALIYGLNLGIRIGEARVKSGAAS
jgi:hypothetical protein